METSLVAIPADDTVGVGRSLEQDPPASSLTTASPAVTTEVRMEPITVAAPAADPLAERQEVLQIQSLGETLGIGQVVRDILASTPNLVEARQKAMAALGERAGKPLPAGPVVELQGKERFSIARAISAKIDGRNCFELEVSQEISRKLGRDTNGIFVPTSTRANPPMDTATAAYGQKLVFTEQGDFIDLLRAKLTLLGLGAQFLTGLRGNVSFPRQLTANTASWLQENAAAAVTATALTTDLVTLTPKQLVAQSSVTRNLLAQSSPAVDSMINNDLASIHAIALEVAALNGAGSGSFQPLGILGTGSIGDVAGGTNGLQPTYGNIIDLESKVAAANADMGTLAYLTSPLIRGRLKQTQQFSSTNGDSVWDYLMATYPKSTATNNVPQTLTKGTASGICHAVLFGNWADLVIGEWGAFELIPDPYTMAGKGLVVLTTNQLVDSAVRRPGSFAAMKDALI
jgi:HK97 family phage major capsid protein